MGCMTMMGMPMTPQQRQKVAEKVTARKTEVAASMGLTLEEFEEQQHPKHDDDHEDHDHESLEVNPEDISGVDEEAVLSFIRTRQEIIDLQNTRIRTLQAQIRHLTAQCEVSDKKVATLRDALTKTRTELKALQTSTMDAGSIEK